VHAAKYLASFWLDSSTYASFSGNDSRDQLVENSAVIYHRSRQVT
jgi:hypothetical protein